LSIYPRPHPLAERTDCPCIPRPSVHLRSIPTLAEQAAKLKEDLDGVILVAGSARLAQGLLAAGLVDELRLMVFPVILGSGKRLFAEDPEKRTLRLVEGKTVGDGVEILTYQPA
jgi:dihydrofolate reductase